MDLRCPAKKFAELVKPSQDEGFIEVSCPSRFCGRHFSTLVIHRFSTQTGKLLDTMYFKSPPDRKVRR